MLLKNLRKKEFNMESTTDVALVAAEKPPSYNGEYSRPPDIESAGERGVEAGREVLADAQP